MAGEWRKVHLGIDAETLEIRAIEITGSRVGDAPMLPDLLGQIPTDQVTADGACDIRTCHAAIAERGGGHHPAPQERQAVDGTEGRGSRPQRCPALLPPSWPNHLQALDRPSPTKPDRGQHAPIKLLGERVISRDFDRQVDELQIRAAVLNRLTTLRTPLTQRAG